MLALLGTIALVAAAFCIVVAGGVLIFLSDHAAADQAVRTGRRGRKPNRRPPRSPEAVNYWT